MKAKPKDIKPLREQFLIEQHGSHAYEEPEYEYYEENEDEDQ